jgi:hypothetical protein
MSRARHKKASGGAMKISGNPNVFKEAGMKKGGKVKRATGGAVERKLVQFYTGGAVKARADRPARKSGGRVGANTSPLSTAHGTTGIGKQPSTQQGGMSD